MTCFVMAHAIMGRDFWLDSCPSDSNLKPFTGRVRPQQVFTIEANWPEGCMQSY